MFSKLMVRSRRTCTSHSPFFTIKRFFFGRSKAEKAGKKSYYELLEIDKSATADEIKKAYFKLAKAHHPDVADSAVDSDFSKINEAYQTLKDEQARKIYDKTGLSADEQKQSGFNFSNFGKINRDSNENKEKISQMFTSYQNYFKMGEKETFHQSRAVGISGIGEKIYDQMNYPADIHLNISVEFDELFEGNLDKPYSRRIVYSQEVMCNKCNGEKKAPGSRIDMCGN